MANAVWDGQQAPTMSNLSYLANKSLDKSKKNYICPKAKPTLGWAPYAMSWGTLYLEKVALPGFNKCSKVNLKVDVTNPETHPGQEWMNGWWGMQLVDTGGKLYGGAIIAQSDLATAGKRFLASSDLKICSYDYSKSFKAMTPGKTLLLKTNQPDQNNNWRTAYYEKGLFQAF